MEQASNCWGSGPSLPLQPDDAIRQPRVPGSLQVVDAKLRHDLIQRHAAEFCELVEVSKPFRAVQLNLVDEVQEFGMFGRGESLRLTLAVELMKPSPGGLRQTYIDLGKESRFLLG